MQTLQPVPQTSSACTPSEIMTATMPQNDKTVKVKCFSFIVFNLYESNVQF